MSRVNFALIILCAGCAPAEQPKWAETVAAYEIPLPSAQAKAQFIQVLNREAARSGYHVDATSQDELRSLAKVSPIKFNAAVWRGDVLLGRPA